MHLMSKIETDVATALIIALQVIYLDLFVIFNNRSYGRFFLSIKYSKPNTYNILTKVIIAIIEKKMLI